MRGTIHVLTPDDALSLRPWVQVGLDQQSGSNQISRPARDVPADDLVAAVRRLLADGPLPVKELGERLTEDFPDVPAAALAHMARERAPLVQVPPRGLWRRSGGVVYQTVETWLGRASAEVDVPRARPALPAGVRPRDRLGHDDVVAGDTARPGVHVDGRRAGPVECEDGRHAVRRTRCAVRLRGRAGTGAAARRPTTTCGSRTPTGRTSWTTTARQRWAGPNGGVAAHGLRRRLHGRPVARCDGRVEVEPFRRLTRAEQADLDAEVARTEALLAPGVSCAPTRAPGASCEARDPPSTPVRDSPARTSS